MEASGPSGKSLNSTKKYLVEMAGLAIAMITLIAPIITIAHFSKIQNTDIRLVKDYTFTNQNQEK